MDAPLCRPYIFRTGWVWRARYSHPPGALGVGGSLLRPGGGFTSTRGAGTSFEPPLRQSAVEWRALDGRKGESYARLPGDQAVAELVGVQAVCFAAMTARDAACHCGQLRLQVEGEPLTISICNCRACQRRTGSAFGMQAGFKADQVHVSGRFGDYARVSDEADRKVHVFHFCPDCGSQVFYTEPMEPA